MAGASSPTLAPLRPAGERAVGRGGSAIRSSPAASLALRPVMLAPQLTLLAGGFSLMEGIVGWAWAEPALVLAALMSAVFTGLLFLADKKRDVWPAFRISMVLSAGVSGLGLLGAVIVPDAGLAVSLLPLLSVVLVLPHALRHRRLIIGSAIGTSAVILVVDMLPDVVAPLRPPLGQVFPTAILLGEVTLIAIALGDLNVAWRKALDAANQALSRQQAIFEGSLDAMLLVDDARGYTDANRAAEDLLGVHRSQIIGRSISDFHLAGDDQAAWNRFLTAGSVRERIEITRPDGTIRTVDSASVANVAPGEHLTAWRDVTAEVHAESERRMLADAVAEAVDGLSVVDQDLRIRYSNPAFGRQLGISTSDLRGRDIRDVVTPGASAVGPGSTLTAILTAVKQRLPWQGELRLTRPSGEEWRASWTIAPIAAAGPERDQYVIVSRDVTHLRLIEERLATVAQERAAIDQALHSLGPRDSAIATAEVICDTITTLPGVDFATIASFDRDDDLVVFAAAGSPVTVGEHASPSRIRDIRARAASGPWTEIWRDRTDPLGRRFAAAGVQAVVMSPIETDHGLVGVLTFGTRSPDYVSHLVEQLPAAVEFTATAKALLGPALEERIDAIAAEGCIRTIVAIGAFSPVFQPIVDLASRRVVGYEALTRFTNGRAPDKVFADAARTGQGNLLERATLESALRASALLPPECWLSLNVSPDLVLTPVLAELVLAQRRPIVVEITEHDPIASYPDVLDALRSLGPNVRVAVDDAGAGIANFAHLLKLRPHLIKVDVGIIHGIDTDRVGQALVAGLRHFASTIGAELIAEGVETAEELATLQGLNVTFGQGYLLGRPLPAPNELPSVGQHVASIRSIANADSSHRRDG
jgi:PAS domain S-box-containing protein